MVDEIKIIARTTNVIALIHKLIYIDSNNIMDKILKTFYPFLGT
jgi:hypothetical protein